jgi:hypothetical protein
MIYLSLFIVYILKPRSIISVNCAAVAARMQRPNIIFHILYTIVQKNIQLDQITSRALQYLRQNIARSTISNIITHVLNINDGMNSGLFRDVINLISFLPGSGAENTNIVTLGSYNISLLSTQLISKHVRTVPTGCQFASMPNNVPPSIYVYTVSVIIYDSFESAAKFIETRATTAIM